MQPQVGGAQTPQLAPPVTTSPSQPVLVPPAPKKPRSQAIWWVLALVVVAATVWYFASSRSREKSGGPGGTGIAVVPTAVVAQGAITRTLRLTGSTKAEKYASLITPQMRGSRNQAAGGRTGNFQSQMGGSPATAGGGRGGGGGGGGRGGNAGGGGGNAGGGGGGGDNSGGGGGGGGGTSSASAGSGSPGVSITSSAGASRGGVSTALRGATSRVSGGSSSSSSSSGSSSSASSSSSSSSSSTSSGGGGGNSGGGGGGGGGGAPSSEFGLTLQNAAKPGAPVKKGQVVAEFDRQNMLLRLDDYRASVAQLEAAFAKLNAELEVEKKAHDQSIATAKADLDKARLDAKTIPVQGKIDGERLRLAVEEAEANYKQIQSEVKFVEIGHRARRRNAELELQEAKSELKRAEVNADRMLIKAPIDGIPVMQSTIRGSELAQIQAGDQLGPGMMFMQIVDTSSMIVSATVNQVDVDQVRVGAKAMVKFDAYPGLVLPAHVHSIAAMTLPGGQRSNFVKEVPVVLKLDQLDPRVIPDLSVSVDVQVESSEQASIVPLTSVFQDGAAGKTYVFVKSGQGWERRDVDLGVSDNLRVQVKSGVRAGEVVATARPDPGGQTT